MTRIDAATSRFEQAELFEQTVLFTDLRVDPGTVPAGLHRYEIRHSDADWDQPCQLARHILVNHFGTIRTNDPIQLPPEGWLPSKEDDFSYLDLPSVTAADYLAEHPPTKRDVMQLYTVEKEEHMLLFSSPGVNEDRKIGCVGHLRGDFGSGQQFYTTWWPHQKGRLNTATFKSDIDRVVNWLRGKTGPLHDFKTMRHFCEMHAESAAVPEATLPSYGFRIDTNQYQYMLRCTTAKGDYFYLYCYDKQAREKEREAPQKPVTKSPKRQRSEPER